MTEEERALLLYLTNVVGEHLVWSDHGPRVTLKLKEMREAAEKSAAPSQLGIAPGFNASYSNG